LIHGQNLTNITLTGGGTIDGQGDVWWKLAKDHKLKHTRGRLIEFMWTDDIVIRDLTLTNSPFWTVHPVYCNRVLIQDLTIINPSDSPNTDGIDPDSSSNVLITDCTISVGDDNIAIKSGMNEPGIEYGWPSANITIQNCVFKSGHGISIGSEMSGGVKNVTVKDCTAIGTDRGPRIKTALARGGYVEDIYFTNIVLSNVGTGISIGMNYSNSYDEGEIAVPPPIFKNFFFENITGTGLAVAGEFGCLSVSHCTGLLLKDIDLSAKKGFTCQFADGSSENVTPATCVS